jgi:LmbE family N-acetylglucosaminyl deacetylase
MSVTTETLRTQFELDRTDHVIIVHAHPDDELSTGGLLDELADGGVNYSAIVATAGEASTRGDPESLRAGIRLREAAAAYSDYGIPHDRQYYLGLPDGRLHEATHHAQLSRSFQKLFAALGVTVVITPGELGFDGHRDHQAVHMAALHAVGALRSDGILMRLFGLDSEGLIHVDVDEQRKLNVLANHRTQFSMQLVNGAWQPTAQSRALLSPYEHLLHDSERYTQYQ